MSDAIRFRLNGRDLEVRGADPNTTLLNWLRGAGLTGSKEGCAEGECGACAVAFVTTAPDGRTRYEAVNGCLVLLGSTHGRELVSVEGIAEGGTLHPVQREMADGGGSQCGYCTPGFVVSLFAEFHRNDEGPLDEESIAGNLCRCTGYRPIRDAAQRLSQLRARRDGDSVHARRLAAPAPSDSPLSLSGARRFHRPTTLADALAILAREPDLTIVSGGTDVVVEINQRHARFDGILALDAIEELRAIRETADYVEIGAGLSLASVEERLHGRVPMLDQLWPLFSSRLIRSRATLGGNLGTASPIGDSPPALLALGAEIVVATAGGDRVVPIDQYFLGYRKTALAKGELVRAVRVPRALPRVQRFYKVSKRRMDDISTVAAAFALEIDPAGIVQSARLAYGGVAATPIRARAAEQALIGQRLDRASVTAARDAAMAELAPIDDHRGSARYRKAMIGTLLEKLLADESGAAASLSPGAT